MTSLVCNKRDKSIKIKKLKRDGYVPGIIYGRNLDESIMIKMELKTMAKEMKKLSVGAQTILNVDGEKYNCLVKEIDFKPLTNQVQHFDFQVMTSGEKIKTSVHIHFINKEAITQEGNVQESLTLLDYEVLPKDMLDSIEVDVSGLTIGHDIKVADLDIMNDERFHVLTPPTTVVVSLAPIKEVVLETEDTAQVAPEEVPSISEE